MANPTRERYLTNLQAEIDGAALYRTLAELEAGSDLAPVYTRMAETEERHAELWRAKLREMGVTDLPHHPGWRTRTLMQLARRFGAGLILPTVIQQEQADSAKYNQQDEARELGLGAEERSHAPRLPRHWRANDGTARWLDRPARRTASRQWWERLAGSSAGSQ